MDRTMLQVLIMFFSGAISFFIANTSISIMLPIMNNMSLSFSFMQGSGVDYGSTSQIFVSAVWIALFISVMIPLAYFFMRLLRREPEPQQVYQPYYA